MSEGNHLEELGADLRIILKRVSKKCQEDMVLVDLAQEKEMWRAFVNGLMNI